MTGIFQEFDKLVLKLTFNYKGQEIKKTKSNSFDIYQISRPAINFLHETVVVKVVRYTHNNRQIDQ